MPSKLYYVYILQCSDGTYYIGQTDNIASRLRIHESGNGPQYTSQRLPVTLVFQEFFEQRSNAMTREKQIKHWSKAKKEALANGNLTQLKKLAKRHVY